MQKMSEDGENHTEGLIGGTFEWELFVFRYWDNCYV